MKFPGDESNIVVLSNKMISGLASHGTDFPSIDPLPLSTAQSEYLAASTAMESAKAAYRAAVTAKNAKLGTLKSIMKDDIKLADVDCAGDPDKLYEIGWAPKSPAVPLAAPGQVEDFIAVTQGPGDITFKWTKAVTGGKASNFIVQRRNEDSTGVFSSWVQICTCFETSCQLNEQPRGSQLEYRIIATNPAGDALPSNTVSAVL
ncbi:MAG: fibronectin type III domain-containing protein [Phycisphaerae bacterium]|nr:fibronectin type III domain-containing protein [Phycisphaerae bacterium]